MGDEKKLKEILKMSMKLTPEESQEFKPTEIDEERKKYLANAINQALENDEGKKLLYLTNLFLAFNEETTYSDSQLENLSKVCEDISYLIEGRDMAIEFDKMSGLSHCLKLLKSKYSSIQWRVADILAECLRNNPKCQKSVLEKKGMIILLHVLKNTEVDIVKVKCVYALSSLTGNFEEAEKQFLLLKGIETLLGIITDEQSGEKILMKSLVLIQKFVFSEAELDIDYVVISNRLRKVLIQEHGDIHDPVLNILLHVIENKPEYKDDIFPDKKETIELIEQRKSELMKKDTEERYLDDIFKYSELVKLLE